MFLSIFARRRMLEEKKTLFRNFIFGVEDSLVSTVGLLSGVAAAGTGRASIITTGVVLIFVEAFSMGVGSFLSEETSQESTKKNFSKVSVFKAAVVMFVSYFLAGFIPLSPYVFTDTHAESLSILFSLLSLMGLGVYSAVKFKGNILRKAVEMLLLGGLATGVGIGIGYLLQI